MFEVGKKGATHFLCRVAGLYRRLSKLKDKNKEQGETEGRQDINDKLDTTRKSGRGTEANRAAAEDKMANQTTIIIDTLASKAIIGTIDNRETQEVPIVLVPIRASHRIHLSLLPPLLERARLTDRNE